MIIRSVRIGSFGNLVDKRLDFGPELNVVYGPNESGKTTYLEFVRRCISPSRRQSYPSASKTDSGTLVYSEEGREHTITLSGRAPEGDKPECVKDIDPDRYRSIFAMTASDLDDTDPLKDVGAGADMLTFPGGELASPAISLLRDRTDRIVGKSSRSRSEVNEARSA
ncbi:MAG: AAA family ATPase, partial [Candidatus Methanomethylophilaceae archaeon]|nr:AAA family ATPase [Candidatus Methanomethylophilaceae archaeon]